MPRLPIWILTAVLAGAAAAQQTEFTLDDAGTWQVTSAPEPGSDGAIIADAARLLAEDDAAGAKRLLNPWIEANMRGDSPLLPRAYVLRGDALTASGDEFQALYDYERVVKEFPGSEEFVTSLEREMEIAQRYVHGLKRRWLGMRIFDAAEVGEELLIRIQERLPQSRLAERAGIELADFYYRDGELELAAEAYDIFLALYPTSEYRMQAMRRQIASNVARYRGAPYDGGGLLEARVLAGRFGRDYPAEARESGIDADLIARLDDAQARQMLHTARWYLKRSDPVSARFELRRILSDYPTTPTARTALEMLHERGWAPVAPESPAPPAAAPEEPPGSPEAGPSAEGPTEPPTEPPPEAPEEGGGR